MLACSPAQAVLTKNKALHREADRTGSDPFGQAAPAGVAALTIYDMCKALDREMIIQDLVLVEKSGGASGDYHRPPPGTSLKRAGHGT